MAGAGQGQDCFSSSPCSHPDPREPPRWRLSAHSRHVAAGCQDIRRGRSENNRPLMFSFQKEGVAIAGNFCDQQSWLIVSSSVSQALAPSHGAAWPPLCHQPVWSSGAPPLLGLPSLSRGATALGLQVEAVPRVLGSRCPAGLSHGTRCSFSLWASSVRSRSRPQGLCRLSLRPCSVQAVLPRRGNAAARR